MKDLNKSIKFCGQLEAVILNKDTQLQLQIRYPSYEVEGNQKIIDNYMYILFYIHTFPK